MRGLKFVGFLRQNRDYDWSLIHWLKKMAWFGIKFVISLKTNIYYQRWWPCSGTVVSRIKGSRRNLLAQSFIFSWTPSLSLLNNQICATYGVDDDILLVYSSSQWLPCASACWGLPCCALYHPFFLYCQTKYEPSPTSSSYLPTTVYSMNCEQGVEVSCTVHDITTDDLLEAFPLTEITPRCRPHIIDNVRLCGHFSRFVRKIDKYG